MYCENAEPDADQVTLTCDVAMGFPTTIDIDWITQAVDDEVTFTVTNLVLIEE